MLELSSNLTNDLLMLTAEVVGTNPDYSGEKH